MIVSIFSSLKWRLFFLVVLVCAPLVGLILHADSVECRRLVTQWLESTREMMQLSAQEEGQWVGQTRQLLLAVAESSSVRSGSRRGTKKLLDELFAGSPRYANLGVIKLDGSILASARPVSEKNQITNRVFFRQVVATREFGIGEYPGSTLGEHPEIYFGYPVLDRDERLQAVVFAVLAIDWVSRYESALPNRLPPGATWSEVDAKGQILLRYPSPEKWIGRPFPEPSLLQSISKAERSILKTPSEDGGLTYHYASSIRSQWIPSQNVTLISSIPESVLFEGSHRQMKGILFGLGVASGVALSLGWIGSQFLVLKPIQRLVESSGRLARGDLRSRTGLSPRRDELGRLAETFDHMAQALEDRELQRQSTLLALRGSETRYRRLFETAQDGILILNGKSGRIDDVNPALMRMIGWTREQGLGQELWNTEPFRSIPNRDALRRILVEPRLHYEELSLQCPNHPCIQVELVSTILTIGQERVVQCNLRDITDRKTAERKQQEDHRKLELLSRRLVEAQEVERRNIARELHDELGQTLTVAQLNLQTLLLLPANMELRGLQESLDAIDRVLDHVRDLALNLRPSVLDDLGLESALMWLTHRQSELGDTRCHFHSDPLPRRLDPLIETACFRVAQEALTNAIRHSRARTVSLNLRQEETHVHLSVKDDGVGFLVETARERALKGKSLGLLGMEERALLVGGRLEIQSHPGQGTQLDAFFPLRWQTVPASMEVG